MNAYRSIIGFIFTLFGVVGSFSSAQTISIAEAESIAAAIGVHSEPSTPKDIFESYFRERIRYLPQEEATYLETEYNYSVVSVLGRADGQEPRVDWDPKRGFLIQVFHTLRTTSVPYIILAGELEQALQSFRNIKSPGDQKPSLHQQENSMALARWVLVRHLPSNEFFRTGMAHIAFTGSNNKITDAVEGAMAAKRFSGAEYLDIYRRFVSANSCKTLFGG